MKKVAFLLLVLAVCFAGANAQTKSIKKSPVLEEAVPESVGVSSERLARIDKMCAEAVQNGDLPGMVSMVVRNGKIVHWKAYGMANNQERKPLKRDDIFRIASQTKALTSTAVTNYHKEMI